MMLSLGLTQSSPAVQQGRPGGPGSSVLTLITPTTVIAPTTQIQGT